MRPPKIKVLHMQVTGDPTYDYIEFILDGEKRFIDGQDLNQLTDYYMRRLAGNDFYEYGYQTDDGNWHLVQQYSTPRESDLWDDPDSVETAIAHNQHLWREELPC